MSYTTVEVIVENGVVRPAGTEALPLHGRGLLTLLESSKPMVTKAEELAAWWEKRDRLPPEEAAAFAKDIEDARASLPPLKSAWD